MVHVSVLAVLAFNKKGRFYESGKGLREELKGLVSAKILKTGGDRMLRYFPTKWTELGDKFGVSKRPLKTYGKSS